MPPVNTKGQKYIVHGGFVRSVSDGQLRYVEARSVMLLYGLAPYQCILVNDEHDERVIRMMQYDPRYATYIHLYPDRFGHYILPTSQGVFERVQKGD